MFTFVLLLFGFSLTVTLCGEPCTNESLSGEKPYTVAADVRRRIWGFALERQASFDLRGNLSPRAHPPPYVGGYSATVGLTPLLTVRIQFE